MELIISLFSQNTATLIGAMFGIFFGVVFILKDSAESNWRKRFRNQVKKGIASGALSTEDIIHIQERWGQDRQSVLFSLRILLSEAVAAEDDELKDKISEIRGLLANHEQREPFSELPENISLQLYSLKDENSAINKQITQLASSLTELYSSNKAELYKQKKFALWGFVVGVLGVLISISSLLIAIPKN